MDHIPTSVEKRSTNTSENNTMNQLILKEDNNQAQTRASKTFDTNISEIMKKSDIRGNIHEHHKLASSHSTN